MILIIKAALTIASHQTGQSGAIGQPSASEQQRREGGRGGRGTSERALGEGGMEGGSVRLRMHAVLRVARRDHG